MLGQNVNVILDKQINIICKKTSNNLLYYGHINDFFHPLHGKRVYVMLTKKDYKKQMVTTIIAIANQEIYNKIIVTAPLDYIYYSPEILYQLTQIAHRTIYSLNCLNEKSCGAIVFHNSAQGLKTLLIKNRNGNHWSFPKGHIEMGESERQTAIREVMEETGLNIKILDKFRETITYKFYNNIRKTVVFFVAETFSSKVIIQKKEIENFKWVNYHEAINTLTFDNDIEVLKKAMVYFKTQNSSSRIQQR